MNIGPYQIEATLGEGGGGIVYRARHTGLNRVVALKVPRLETLGEQGVERFRREVTVMKDLNHDNLVKLYDVGLENSVVYLAMELIEGSDLDKLQADGKPLSPAYAVDIAAKIADALDHLHANRVIHRDIKPANILLAPRDVVKVADFGLALAANSRNLTATGAVVGTPAYMSPELLSGGAYTTASDMWAVGCVLYRLLTGCGPTEKKDLQAVLMLVLEKEIPPPISVNPDIPPDLNQLVMELLVKDPSARLSSAASLRDRLRPSLPAPPPEPTRERRRPTAQRSIAKPVTAVSSGESRVSLLVAFALSLGIGWYNSHQVLKSQEGPRAAQEDTGQTPLPDTSFFGRWRKAKPLLAASASTDRLREATGLDLGKDPARWAYWVQLGEWLVGTGKQLPRSPRSQPGPLDAASRAALLTALKEGLVALRPEEWPALLEAAENHPSDPLVWLALGFLLEREGCAPEAQLVSTLYLDHLDEIPAPIDNRFLWAALLAAPIPKPPVATLWRWIPPGADPELVCAAILEGLRQRPPEQVSAVLTEAARHYPNSCTPLVYMVEYHQTVRRDYVRAVDEIKSQGKACPRVMDQLRNCVRELLSRGELSKVEELRRSVPLHPDDATIANVVGGSDLKNAYPHSQSKLDQIVCLALIGRLELERATACLVSPTRQLDLTGTLPLVQLKLELMGVDSVPRRGRMSHDLRDFPATLWDAWDTAAGALASETGQTYMEALLARGERSPRTRPAAFLARALWYSRRGLYDASLEAYQLAAAGNAWPDGATAAVVEVLSRPLLEEPRTSIRWSRWSDEAQRLVSGREQLPAIALLDAVRSGNTDDIAQRSRVLASRDPRPYWLLTFARAVRNEPVAQLNTRPELTRLRPMVLFQGHGLWALKELAGILTKAPSSRP